MIYLTAASLTIGVAGLIAAGLFYRELHKWARMCQLGRIGIAYNSRVQLHATLSEWVQWTRMLHDDEKSKGRVIYRNGKMTVFLTRSDKVDTTTVKTVKPVGKNANADTERVTA